jgi:hypothetical protein
MAKVVVLTGQGPEAPVGTEQVDDAKRCPSRRKRRRMVQALRWDGCCGCEEGQAVMRGLCMALLLAFGVWGPPDIARAHGFGAPEDQSGFAIPSIDHAAMQVIAPFRDRIVILARGAASGDAELSARLLHNQMQAANCLWLMVPGSLTDEDNPFNECAHADMAGLKAMVERMSLIPQTEEAARTLISDLDHDMVLAGTSFVLCAFSRENFNTASQVRPDWLAAVSYLAKRHWLGLSFWAFSLFLAALAVLVARSHAAGERQKIS